MSFSSPPSLLLACGYMECKAGMTLDTWTDRQADRSGECEALTTTTIHSKLKPEVPGGLLEHFRESYSVGCYHTFFFITGGLNGEEES